MDEHPSRVRFQCIHCDERLSVKSLEPDTFNFVPCLLCRGYTILFPGSALSWTECQECGKVVSHQRTTREIECTGCFALLKTKSGTKSTDAPCLACRETNKDD